MGDVIREGDEFWLYYTDLSRGINLATSADGIHWMPYEGNPVFTPGSPGSWNHAFVQDAAIVQDSEMGEFEMWYNTAADVEDLLTTSIGYAVSRVGCCWEWAGGRSGGARLLE